MVIFDCEDSCGDICEDRCRDSYEDSCCLLTLLYNSLDCEDRCGDSFEDSWFFLLTFLFNSLNCDDNFTRYKLIPVVRYYCRIEYDIEMKKNSALFPNSQE